MTGIGPSTLIGTAFFVSRVQMIADRSSTSQIFRPVAWWTPLLAARI
jgi:hypothetical protein